VPEVLRRRAPLFWIGATYLFTCATVAALAPVLAPYDPFRSTGLPLARPTADHLLGTNDLGQDILAQLIYGARSSLIVAVVVTVLSTALSWLVGLVAGAIRPVEAPLMAVCDLLLALPSIPLYLLVLTLIGSTRTNLIVVLALLSWPGIARVVRSLVIGARTAPYVEASTGMGGSPGHIMRYHLLPATLDVLPTSLVLTVRFAVFAETTLAFLGLASSDTVSWGTMLSWAFNDPLLFSRPIWPWLVMPPTVAIVLLILSTVWVGSGLAEAPPGRTVRPPAAGRQRG